MLRLIVLLAFVATLNSVLSDTSSFSSSGASTQASFKASSSSAHSSASSYSSSSGSSSATATSSSTSSNNNNNNGAKCKQNEEYSTCPNRCRARTCDQLGFPLPCFQTQSNSTSDDCGQPACACIQGFVKNKAGVCIASKDCPSCGGDPNAVSGSGTFCRTCDNYKNEHIPCPLIFLFNGCDCKPNYVYDTNKKRCVLPEQCPKKTPQCGQNEVYDTCPASCPPYTCETKDRQYKCLAPLKPGDPNCKPAACRCADNYYRNSNGKCVLKSECPQCGQNEVFSSCVNGGCGKRNCTQRLQPALCIDLIEGACRTGCVCQDGFLRTAAGDCVAENECPSNEVCSKPHEYFDLCPASCPARTCGIDDRVVLCAKPPQPGDPDCNPPNCRCEEGYYRTPEGDCVPFEQCPPVCGKNEVPFDCVNSFCLRNKCSQKDLNVVCRRKPTNCTAGCICADGYLRADNGTCVPKDQCPPSCGQFEVYSDCVNGGCDKRNCSQLGRPDICIDLVAGACKKGCVCQKNYLRNADGVCVPIDKCPSSEVCSKPHEYYDQCPATCPARKCGTDDRLVRCKAPLQPGDPNCPLPECRCESGYYRNNYGDCVTFEECSIICGPNETYDPCPKPTCANQTCENIDKIYNCPLIPANYTCKGECRCQPNFYRNAVGRCISRDECKQCQGPNEYFDCDNACDNECDKLSYQSHASCPIQNIQCNRMCYCLDGYARNSDKICIPISQCPPSCKENEEYSTCPNQECRAKTCDELGFPLNCLQPDYNTTDCGQPTCICKSGYLKNKDGVCVLAENCPSCGGDPNAGPGCGVFCTTCDNYNSSGVACPLACEVNGCECRSGYVYNTATKQCVLKSECTIVCGQNEIYDPCPKPTCANQTCENIDKIYNCPLIPANYTCKGECRCQPDFYRNAVGRCISRDECKQCQGPNEYFDCDNACDNECDKLSYQSHASCPILNIQCNRMCYCLDGYARNSDKICIPISQCPPSCKENEEYSTCPNQECRAKTCDELGFPLNCLQPGYNTTDCGQPTCICQSGYLKNKDGVCVLAENCPSCGGDPNAGPGCGVFCTTCDNYNSSGVACPLFCEVNGCECRSGYVYNTATKQCVLKSECTKVCGQNEIYDPCPKPTCANQTCENIDKIYNCPLIPANYTCKGECRCQPDFYRNAVGRCISRDECKQCQGPNEYFDCDNACDNECDKLSYQSHASCPIQNIQCNRMCYCLDGYARNSDKICIPISQCPQSNQIGTTPATVSSGKAVELQ